MATLNVVTYGVLPANTGAQNVAAFPTALAAATAGDVLYWPNGTYDFTLSGLRSMLVSKAVTLLGESRAGVKLRLASSVTGGVGTTARLLEVTASNVIIEQMTLSGNKPTNPGAFSNYDPNVEHHMGVFAGPDISDFTIKNCTVEDFEGDGVQIYTGVVRPMIDTCTFQWCQRSGHSFTPTDPTRPVRDAMVRWNTYRGIAGQPSDNEHGAVYGMDMYGNTFASGVNNYAVTCSGYATSAAEEVKGSANRSKNWHIWNNTFGQAIFLIRCDSVLVEQNTWTNPSTKPCVDISRSATDITIDRNNMVMTQTTTASVAAVSIIGTREDSDGAGPSPPWYAYPTNIIVSNNTITVSGHINSFGVRAESFESVTIAGNMIAGPGTTGTFRGGVYLRAPIPERSCGTATIERNTISNWGDCGISCNGNGAAKIKHVFANKNTFFSLPKAMSFDADNTHAVQDIVAQGNMFGAGVGQQVATIPPGATTSIGGDMSTLIIGGFGYTVYGSLTDTGVVSAPDPIAIGVDHYMAGSSQKADTWAALTTDQRSRLLVDATRALDRLPWAGAKTVSTQALAWPRTGVTRADGSAVDSTLYPLEVIYACYEMAYVILQDPSQAQTPTGTGSNVKSVQAGRAKVEFFQPQPGVFVAQPVWDLIGIFLGVTGSSSTLVIAHGTNDDSSFDCPGDFFQLGRLV